MRASDCVVVGAGVIGAVVARRLAAAGVRVEIVDDGRDGPVPAGQHVRNDPQFAADPDGYFPAIDTLVDHLDLDAAPEALPGAFTTSISGGMSIVWTNNCPRAVAGLDRPDLLDDAQWDRHYSAAEEALGVQDGGFADSVRARWTSDRLAAHLTGQGRSLVPLPLAGRRTPTGIHYDGPADVLGDASGITRRRGHVSRVTMAGDRVSGVIVDGEHRAADAVIVAAGAIASPRLLARSGIDHPALGSHLSYHPVLIGQIVLDMPARAYDALPRLCIPPTADRPWFLMLLRDTNPLPPAKTDRDVDPNLLIEVQAFSPVEPRRRNRMSVDEGPPRFDVPLGADDESRRRAIMTDAEEMCSLLGRWRRGCEPTWIPPGTGHLMGSVRAGRDPADSVLDHQCRVRGVDNLIVAGTAVIPTRLAVNPTLTAAALAIAAVDDWLAAAEA